MPRISYFYGIAIYLYFEDHPPPHVHARYAGAKAKFSIDSGSVVEDPCRHVLRDSSRPGSAIVAKSSTGLGASDPRARPRYDRAVDLGAHAMDITRVEVLQDQVVRLTFTDGTVRDVDLAPYLHGPVFERIRSDAAAFATVFVDHDAGTIAWPNGADLAPDVLYDGRPSARMEMGSSSKP